MTCHTDSDCIVWADDPVTGSPMAIPFISDEPENDIACVAEAGLYVPKGLQVTACQAFPAVTQIGVPGGVFQSVVESGSLTLTNPTDDRVMNVVCQIAFGASRMVCLALAAPSVGDWIKTGLSGALGGFGPTDRVGFSSFEDHNLTVVDAKSVITIPGRTIPIVICPSLPPGASAEVKYQRTVTTAGASGALTDFLLQPTLIQLWGIVV